MLRAAGRDSEIEPLYRRILAIWEESLGGAHPNVASALNNLALLHVDKGENEKAEPLIRRAVGILEKALGPDPYVAAAMRNHAVCQ